MIQPGGFWGGVRYTQALEQRSRKGVRNTLKPRVPKLQDEPLGCGYFQIPKTVQTFSHLLKVFASKTPSKALSSIGPHPSKQPEKPLRQCPEDRRRQDLDSQPSYSRTSCSETMAVQELYLQKMTDL